MNPETETLPDGYPMETSTTSAVQAPGPSDRFFATHEKSVQPSLHTNSMVTIRLSDSTIIPSEECAIEDSPIDPSTFEDPERPMASQHDVNDTAQEPQGTNTHSVSESGILEAEVKFFQRSHRMSMTSMPSIAEEGDSAHGPTSIRSRSQSSGTISSASSTHVDWEELDKSEEAAPRDEGSDEVS